jgi:DNA replication protein DnaC
MADCIEIDGWHVANDPHSESLNRSPEPPQGHVLHRVLWWAARSYCDIQTLHRRNYAGKANLVKKALADLPRWATRASDQDRRAAIHPKLLKAIDNWDGKRSLVLLGPTGLGKTTSLVEATFRRIAREYDLTNWPVPTFTKAATLTQAWRTTKLGEDEIDAPIVTTAKTCPLLFIDDIGQEANDPQATLMGIADARYDRGRITIVTSGLKLDSFIERYGDAFLRRFMDAGGKDSGKVIDLWKAQ